MEEGNTENLQKGGVCAVPTDLVFFSPLCLDIDVGYSVVLVPHSDLWSCSNKMSECPVGCNNKLSVLSLLLVLSLSGTHILVLHMGPGLRY